jgi:hypothetical protein
VLLEAVAGGEVGFLDEGEEEGLVGVRRPFGWWGNEAERTTNSDVSTSSSSANLEDYVRKQ